jgi:hypothetical protein
VRTAVNDSINKLAVRIDSTVFIVEDSIAAAAKDRQAKDRLEKFQRVLKENPVFLFTRTPVKSNLLVRDDPENEALFYFLVGLIFYFGCIRLFFGKYLDNLVTLFFRVTMRQQ